MPEFVVDMLKGFAEQYAPYVVWAVIGLIALGMVLGSIKRLVGQLFLWTLGLGDKLMTHLLAHPKALVPLAGICCGAYYWWQAPPPPPVVQQEVKAPQEASETDQQKFDRLLSDDHSHWDHVKEVWGAVETLEGANVAQVWRDPTYRISDSRYQTHRVDLFQGEPRFAYMPFHTECGTCREVINWHRQIEEIVGRHPEWAKRLYGE